MDHVCVQISGFNVTLKHTHTHSLRRQQKDRIEKAAHSQTHKQNSIPINTDNNISPSSVGSVRFEQMLLPFLYLDLDLLYHIAQ